ncbi:phosphoribosylaminoimidazolesuccinocarboxamide synthase [Adhaeribacter pallidiroseus]|uniref:Phosphoribosylaminoimidazole-succinocarboxamide synthase n=1 Tax=Adhaeribacter pallidiroseus TaxID=2072847 RepID=A0A369QC19_9BACT|nr:phosphoribosylaminoimidazolesuccinocarboxamide synthase [Adhaeribacter pallidiroseus]RDC62441.1 Phosphoribosylaminoimidazolesuccinocarboxamide synthase [Adhaeribacter pallidiroseus]
MQALKETNYNFDNQTGFYRGKVRDVYYFQDKLAVVATDRISAFDVVLPRAIPYKGQVLNQIAATFLKATADIVPNWVVSHPDPNVTIGINCEPFKVEMVIRGYLAGHAWREYQSGKRAVCGVALPEGLKENDPLPEPIITPTTKAAEGHDADISAADIVAQGIVALEDYRQLEEYTYLLFARGTEIAAQRGLLLVDTKYEFGKANDKIYLIDEVHTPDSSRYFYAEGYEERQKAGATQKQLSKEFVRKWLIENNFQGKTGQRIPEMDDDWISSISERYIELFEVVTGNAFEKTDYNEINNRIKANILQNV